MTQPDYYFNGKRMSPTKLIYTINERVQSEVREGTKKEVEDAKSSVISNVNFFRFTDQYLQSPRDYI